MPVAHPLQHLPLAATPVSWPGRRPRPFPKSTLCSARFGSAPASITTLRRWGRCSPRASLLREATHVSLLDEIIVSVLVLGIRERSHSFPFA